MYEQVVIDLLSKFIADGAGDAYLEDGMSDLYIDYNEVGELKDSDDLRKLAEIYAKEADGNLKWAAEQFVMESDWWLDTESYYTKEVEDACDRFIDNLTMSDLPADIDPVDSDGEILSDDEIIDEIQSAYYEMKNDDLWTLFDQIGYEGVNMSDVIDYFPSEVKVDVSFGEVSGGYYYGRLEKDETFPVSWYVDENYADYGPLNDFIVSQGIDPKEFFKKYVHYANSDDNPFVNSDSQEISIANEIESGTLDSYAELFAAAKVSLEDYCKLASGMSKTVTVLPSCYLFGLFDPWNGGGSALEVEIKSPFTHEISGIQVDMGNKRGELGYTIDDVYGLVDSAYVEDAIVLD